MNTRPEWVHCIGHTRTLFNGYQERVPWCSGGWELNPFFEDASHAAECGRLGGRLVACRECVAEIITALRNGHDDASYPP